MRAARLERRRVRESKAGATPEQHARKLAGAAKSRQKLAKLMKENPEAYAALKAKRAAERAARIENPEAYYAAKQAKHNERMRQRWAEMKPELRAKKIAADTERKRKRAEKKAA